MLIYESGTPKIFPATNHKAKKYIMLEHATNARARASVITKALLRRVLSEYKKKMTRQTEPARKGGLDTV